MNMNELLLPLVGIMLELALIIGLLTLLVLLKMGERPKKKGT